ncbi:MAG: hypothetical protein ACRC76_00515 [Proteocatella sp.]
MSSFGETDAIFSYEQLLLKQPHLKVDGIYKFGSGYYIKCENLEVLPLDSKYKTMLDAFNNEIRICTCPIELVTEIPNGSVSLEQRNTAEMINLSGNPLNVFDFNKQVALLLSAALPKLWIEFNHSIHGWDVFLERAASKDEENIIKNKINMLSGYDATVIFKIGLNLKDEYNDTKGLSLAVSRLSVFNYSKSIMDKWEEDEQIWSENKVNLFSTPPTATSDAQKIQQRSSCLINSLNCETYNIRNYLTLFKEVILVVPTGDKIEELLHSLDLTQKELFKLLEINRMKLIFPQSINLYNKEFLENTVAINPSNLIFSRELAYRTVNDLKCRNPLAFLPLPIDEKKEVLLGLLDLASKQHRYEWINGLANELSNAWCNMYEVLAIRGALGTFNVGLGPIINTMIKALNGKDYFLEIMQAANSIEWAAANQAVLCPVGPLAQNEINLAYLYSGVRKDWNFGLITQPNIATEGILTIAKHVPVEELAIAFTGNEIDQFRKVLVDITHNKTPEELGSTVQAFNESVKRFEKNRKRLDTWDVQGVSLDAALEVSNLAIPFSGFIVKRLGNLVENLGDRYKCIDKMLRQVEAKTHMTSPNVVLVSRMRDKVKDLL